MHVYILMFIYIYIYEDIYNKSSIFVWIMQAAVFLVLEIIQNM